MVYHVNCKVFRDFLWFCMVFSSFLVVFMMFSSWDLVLAGSNSGIFLGMIARRPP